MKFLKELFFGKKKKSEKLRVYSMRKIGDITVFKIEKRQDFFRKFRKLLNTFGFKEVDSWHYDPTIKREFPISKLKNFVDSFKNKNFNIIIIFTEDMEIIIVKSSENYRKKFLEEIMKFCEWYPTKLQKKKSNIRKNF